MGGFFNGSKHSGAVERTRFADHHIRLRKKLKGEPNDRAWRRYLSEKRRQRESVDACGLGDKILEAIWTAKEEIN